MKPKVLASLEKNSCLDPKFSAQSAPGSMSKSHQLHGRPQDLSLLRGLWHGPRACASPTSVQGGRQSAGLRAAGTQAPFSLSTVSLVSLPLSGLWELYCVAASAGPVLVAIAGLSNGPSKPRPVKGVLHSRPPTSHC